LRIQQPNFEDRIWEQHSGTTRVESIEEPTRVTQHPPTTARFQKREDTNTNSLDIFMVNHDKCSLFMVVDRVFPPKSLL